MKLEPYLNLPGNTEAAFRFYETVFDGRIVAMMRFGDGPMKDNVDPSSHDLVMHARIEIDGQALMATDCTPFDTPKGFGDMFICVGIDDTARAERIFAALADGGDVQMPIQETFWAARYGIVRDRFGVPWMINGGARF